MHACTYENVEISISRILLKKVTYDVFTKRLRHILSFK